MTAPEDHQRGFERVVALSEASKALLARSFKVNLLALDAMVQSKRGGGNLRGFDEVSSQMRLWSRDLHRDLQQLEARTRNLVARTSLVRKEKHTIDLLRAAALASRNSALLAAYEARGERHEALERELAGDWRAVREMLGDLDQLGLMAIVLSRSAMIEASSGSQAQREQLSSVSREFYRNSEAVTETIKTVLKTVDGR
ncbi:MAG TPA: hypothetical protein VMI54_05470 [Polyangiaceae bacterium]|nr:hypothetical protein [Polyangiaceae bacterium]